MIEMKQAFGSIFMELLFVSSRCRVSYSCENNFITACLPACLLTVLCSTDVCVAPNARQHLNLVLDVFEEGWYYGRFQDYASKNCRT